MAAGVTARHKRRGLDLLFAVALALPQLSAPSPISATASGCDPNDLLCGIQPVPETALNSAACAQAAVAMLLEGYGNVPGATPHDKLAAVATYVRQWGYMSDGHFVPRAGGLTPMSELPNLVPAAASFGIPVTGAVWRRTTTDAWLADLKTETTVQRRPTIVLLPDLTPIWPSMKSIGHYVVVAGISADGRIIEHDAWDGQVHLVDQPTFRKAWSAPNPNAPAYEYLDVVAAGQPLTARPGGTWIEPADGGGATGSFHVSVHAYPTNPGDPPIDHVIVTLWWPTLGPKSGPWKVACMIRPPPSGDVFGCDVDPATLGAPPGQLAISFDVVDDAGDVTHSAGGIRTVTLAAMPTPTPRPTKPAAPTQVSGGAEPTYFKDQNDPRWGECLDPNATGVCWTVSLRWHDASTNESGFRIYVQDCGVPGVGGIGPPSDPCGGRYSLIKTLPANSTSATLKVVTQGGRFWVAAYNATGESRRIKAYDLLFGY